MTRSGNCRRCRKPLREVKQPEATPVVIQAPQPMPVGSYDFGTALAWLRKAQGLSQNNLAVIIRSPRTYISKLETGVCDPTLKSLKRLCDGLGLSQYTVMRFAQLCAEAKQ